MSDASGGYSVGSGGDRLSMMRAPGAQAQPARKRELRGMRIEFIIGILLIVGGLALALWVRGGPDTAPVVSVATVAGPAPDSAANPESGLLAGEVAVSFAVEDGDYPPALRIGDVVRLVVTPSMDGEGQVRLLSERTVVLAIDEPADAGNKRVVTVRGPESIVASVAGSGPVHVAILGGEPS